MRIVGGTVGQTRARWVRPAQVSDTELTVLVPTEMTGAGLLEVETSAGRSGVVIVQYLDARPRITLLKRLPFETVVALTSATPLPESGELLVDGQTAGAVTRTGESTYSAPSMFHRTGPHDVTVRFADGLETPPYSVP
ncbi:MAG: hypothetical protein HY904_15525 [Deltaproteobacteria bacterium]|nr:hypothetical protein [Deltaproteobacteria bacterium]